MGSGGRISQLKEYEGSVANWGKQGGLFVGVPLSLDTGMLLSSRYREGPSYLRPSGPVSGEKGKEGRRSE